MNKFCQCYYCKKKFPTFDKYAGRISKSKYLSRPKKVLMGGILIGKIDEICFKCEEKLYDKIREIAHRKIKDRLIYNRETRCSICDKEFSKYRSNLHQSSQLKIGTTIIFKLYEFCNQCHEEIINEIKVLL